jgi:hypothetical protein
MDEVNSKNNSWGAGTWQTRTRASTGAAWSAWSSIAAATGPIAGTTSSNVSDGTGSGVQLLSNAPAGSYEQEGDFQANAGAAGDWAFTKNNYSEWETCIYLTTGATTGWQAQVRLLPTNYASTGSNVLATITSLGTTVVGGVGKTITTVADAALQAGRTETSQADAAVLRLGLTQTGVTDAALQKKIYLGGVAETEETGTLFASGLEDETSAFTTDFTGKTEGGTTTVEVQTTTKRTGADAAKCNFDGSNGNTNFYKTGLSTSGNDFYARGYFYLDSSYDHTSTADQIIIFTMLDGATALCDVQIQKDATPDWRIMLRARNPTDEWVDFSAYGDVVKSGWHRLEVHFKKNATVGGYEAWLDGVSFASKFTYNTSAYQADEIYFGPRSTTAPSAGAQYWDDIRAEESGPLGPYTPAQGGLPIDAALATSEAQVTDIGAALLKTILATAGADAALTALAAITAGADAHLAVQAAAKSVTTSADAALELARTIATSFDAALEIDRLATGDIDAALERRRDASANLDAAFLRLFNVATDLNAAIEAGRTDTASADAALRAAFAATLGMNAAVATGRATSGDIDAAVQILNTATATLGAALEARRTVTGDVDAHLIEAGAALVTALIDAALQSLATATTDIDAALAVAASATLEADAVLQRYAILSGQVDAALRGTGLATGQIDAVLTGAGTFVLTSLDAALRAAGLATTDVNAVLSAVRSATAGADAHLISTLGGIVQTSIDAAVRRGVTTTGQLDTALEILRNATANVDAAVAVQNVEQSVADAVVAAQIRLIANVDAAMRGALQTTASLSAYLRTAILPPGTTPSGRTLSFNRRRAAREVSPRDGIPVDRNDTPREAR